MCFDEFFDAIAMGLDIGSNLNDGEDAEEGEEAEE
jgi:hypothetical protein